jgi:hypothetical protein
MGHNVIAGYCSEQVIAGAAMLRVDVPADTDTQPCPVAFTKYFAASSIYGITPTTEAAARLAASRIKARPVSLYILPETMPRRLLAGGDYVDPDAEFERRRDHSSIDVDDEGSDKDDDLDSPF